MSTRQISSFFGQPRNDELVQGEVRSLIKLRVSDDELQRALSDRSAAARPSKQPTTLHARPASSAAAELPSPTSPPSAVHPTIASYNREDVLSAEPDTLRALAEAGHPFAQHYLGILLMTGSEGLPLDRQQAAHYLHRSIQQQHSSRIEPLSLFFLAALIDEQQQQQQQQDQGTQERKEEEQRWTGRPAVSQPALAAVGPSWPSPLSLYRRYCESSSPASPFHYEALFRVARLLLRDASSGGSEADRAAAGEWMERAARGGHAEAMLHVAEQRLSSGRLQDQSEAGRQAAAIAEQEARVWMQKAKGALEKQLQQEAQLGPLLSPSVAAPAGDQLMSRNTASKPAKIKTKKHRR